MIDARGLSCPLPVVMVQKAVKKDAPVTCIFSGFKYTLLPQISLKCLLCIRSVRAITLRKSSLAALKSSIVINFYTSLI